MSFKFTHWPTEYKSINQPFGANPDIYGQFNLAGHEGVDIQAPTSSRIFAVADGRVRMVQNDPNAHNYGIHIRIDHADGFQTIYAHFKQAQVQNGQEVKAGQQIGIANNTGNSTGSHLHISLKKEGAQLKGYPAGYIDPTPFLAPLLGFVRPEGPYTSGWAYTSAIMPFGDLAQAGNGGINLRADSNKNAELIGLVPGGTVMIIMGNKRGPYTPVDVPTRALEGSTAPPPTDPTPPPPPTVSTVDGWGYAPYLMASGDQAIVGEYGINLRMEPNRNGENIGVVAGGSTVSIIGTQQGEYLPVRARRDDFIGAINLPPTALPPVDEGGKDVPVVDGYTGWAWTEYLMINGRSATAGQYGINLRSQANSNSQNIGLFKGGATADIIGESKGEYTPIAAAYDDVLNAITPQPAIEEYVPFEDVGGGEEPTQPPPVTPQDSTPGWAFSTSLQVNGDHATVNLYGLNLRDAPRRDATNIGFVPENTVVMVTGAPQGEYTPVRVDDEIIENPYTPTPPSPGTPYPDPGTPDEPTLYGDALIGLHASADPGISDAEIGEFHEMRPGIIKVLSFHDPAAISKLAANEPNAKWVVRAFLDFGGRNITPAQFLNDTLSDVQRTLNLLQGKDVVIELHNEPNLQVEGLHSSWADGAGFNKWWLELLRLYRNALPGRRFIFPGLSPGHSVSNVKQDHIFFIESCREAVDAADGLAVHIYWSNVYPMSTALGVLDDYIARFQFRPMWVTEASNNKDGTSSSRKAHEYLKFWNELQKRPTVQGVTYFVASASNPIFDSEVWLGRGIAAIVGSR